MKSYSFQAHYAIVLSFTFALFVTGTNSLVSAEPAMLGAEEIFLKARTPEEGKLFEGFVQSWNALEDIISEASNNIVDFIEDIFHSSNHQASKFAYDLTLVGFVNYADGIGRHPILFKECLGKNAKINFLSTRDISPEIEDSQLGLPRLDPTRKQDVGAIAILTDILADKALSIYKKMPDSHIKVAYTMFESTEIPNNWVTILNNKFDMAVVPDSFLCDVYRKCGVQIPLFVLPLPLMLQDFLKIRPRTTPHKQFVFGLSGGFWKRKNHMQVLEAFAAEFGNHKDVKLKLHGRFGEEEIIKELADKISEYKLTNVELIVKPYNSEEYLDFFKSLDCYVFLSMGEGFSITPREALACGKPCILTNNTAQITICNSGTVRVVPSNILVPALYDCHYDNYPNSFGLSSVINHNLKHIEDEIDLFLRSACVGYQFDCETQDARDAMRDVYNNYSEYLLKAKRGREWVKGYLHKNLSSKYVSLVKPKSVVLGTENIIGDKFLMTNSRALYEKYRYILGYK